MKLLSKSTAVVLGALALAVVPATAASATEPFKNCTAAYKAGYSHIPESDPHYGPHLDRDKDGIGCDAPPKDFVAKDPAKDKDEPEAPADEGSENTDGDDAAAAPATSTEDKELAETGGDDTTAYLTAGGAAVLLAGGGLVVVNRRRRSSN
ncbi:LPXTG cell wall anchor domain-containing protein [Streptomyces armeniacus]|uniref:LPXTG cell wall anchor domain-containing protein n=1 Tax=Streptomyces armeniacus TaxID=83291 RepID=A0A345XM89_9ACTN|nr:excalibur calcium-binding domain-containing protein [Streptomyces armeniacus]AXK32755.1 LPXTG cell wall anchor domain-containing protein [Streptomyces armeniacus]